VILVTLCGVAVVAMLAIPAFFGRHDVTLDNDCLLLIKDLRSAQNRAALFQTEANFRFDEHGWLATDAAGYPLTNTMAPIGIERRFSSDGVFEGVSIARIDCGDEDSIVFDDRGLAAEPGEVELAFRGHVRVLRIEKGSGQVTVYDGAHAVLSSNGRGRSALAPARRCPR
jgi:hypothetical protein